MPTPESFKSPDAAALRAHARLAARAWRATPDRRRATGAISRSRARCAIVIDGTLTSSVVFTRTSNVLPDACLP
jgi:hypothetical protein